MSYLSAKNAGVLESGGGGGLPGTQNLEEVLSLGASAGGIAITSCPSISNSSGVVALSGESLTLTSQGLVGVVAPLGLAISGDVGALGYVLTSGGVGAPPAWEVSGAGVTPTLAAVMDVGAQASVALDMHQFAISNPSAITANNSVGSFVIKNIAAAGMTLGSAGKPLTIVGSSGVGTVDQILQSNGTSCDWKTVSGLSLGLSDVTLVNATMSANLDLNNFGISAGSSLGVDGQVLTSTGTNAIWATLATPYPALTIYSPSMVSLDIATNTAFASLTPDAGTYLFVLNFTMSLAGGAVSSIFINNGDTVIATLNPINTNFGGITLGYLNASVVLPIAASSTITLSCNFAFTTNESTQNTYSCVRVA